MPTSVVFGSLIPLRDPELHFDYNACECMRLSPIVGGFLDVKTHWMCLAASVILDVY